MLHDSGEAGVPARAAGYLADVDLFSRSWAALRTAVAELPDEDFARPSDCTGWLVRDLVCHLIIDAQDVLITLVTPADTEPTRDALSYWHVAATPPAGDDPLDALTVRLAAAYEQPWLLRFLSSASMHRLKQTPISTSTFVLARVTWKARELSKTVTLRPMPVSR